MKNIFKDAMSNIFSNKLQEEIPLELDACVETDDVVRHLFRWAYNTETIGQILFYMVMLLVFPAFGTPISEEGGFLGVLIGLLYSMVVVLGAFIIRSIWHAIALLIGTLALNTQNRAISAKVGQYESIGCVFAAAEQKSALSFYLCKWNGEQHSAAALPRVIQRGDDLQLPIIQCTAAFFNTKERIYIC